MVVVVSAQSPAKYPAGVDPAKCPKYELIKLKFQEFKLINYLIVLKQLPNL